MEVKNKFNTVKIATCNDAHKAEAVSQLFERSLLFNRSDDICGIVISKNDEKQFIPISAIPDNVNIEKRDGVVTLVENPVVDSITTKADHNGVDWKSQHKIAETSVERTIILLCTKNIEDATNIGVIGGEILEVGEGVYGNYKISLTPTGSGLLIGATTFEQKAALVRAKYNGTYYYGIKFKSTVPANIYFSGWDHFPDGADAPLYTSYNDADLSEIIELGGGDSGGGMTEAEKAEISAMNTQINTNKSDISALKTSVAGKADTGHTHSANDITSGVLLVERGGTGCNTAQAAADSLISNLPASDNVPVDTDYFISQIVNGGPFVPGYERRPISKLWEYIKSKISSVLGLTKDNYGGKAATATTASKVGNSLTFGSKTYNGSSAQTITASDLGALTAHQTIKQDGITGATVNRFGTCSTAASTAAKTVSITNGTFSLEAGARVSVKFSNANTANTPTLNVANKGAKNIFHKGAQITTGENKALLAGVCDFIYDGTQWHLIGNYIDTTYSDATQTSAGLMSAADKKKLDDLEKYTKEYKVSAVTSETIKYIKLGEFNPTEGGNISCRITGDNFDDTIDINILGGNFTNTSVSGYYSTKSKRTLGIRISGTISQNIGIYLKISQLTTATVKVAVDKKYQSRITMSENGLGQYEGVLTDISFSNYNGLFGNLTGDVTGNVSGSSGSCTGNSATANNGFNSSSVADSTPGWGYLTSGNGYTNGRTYNFANGGGIATAEKDAKSSLQVDGDLYVHEGLDKVATLNDIPTSLPANGGTANTATTAANLGRNGNTGIPMTFNWSGQGGQPSWLWGGNDGSNMYVYNPSNFSVNTATTAYKIRTSAPSSVADGDIWIS